MSVDRKSTRLNSSHLGISYAVFCLKKKKESIDGAERSGHYTHPQRRRRGGSAPLALPVRASIAPNGPSITTICGPASFFFFKRTGSRRAPHFSPPHRSPD